MDALATPTAPPVLSGAPAPARGRSQPLDRHRPPGWPPRLPTRVGSVATRRVLVPHRPVGAAQSRRQPQITVHLRDGHRLIRPPPATAFTPPAPTTRLEPHR